MILDNFRNLRTPVEIHFQVNSKHELIYFVIGILPNSSSLNIHNLLKKTFLNGIILKLMGNIYTEYQLSTQHVTALH